MIKSDDNWKYKIGLIKESGYVTDELGIFRGTIEDSDSRRFHTEHTKGAYLRKLQDVPHHQAQWETPYYVKVLDDFLKVTEIQDKIILDLGCGDGRFTQYLLERGAQKIVCVDFDYGTLSALAQFVAERGFSDNVLIVHSDIMGHPLQSGQFDLVLAIGSLYYLNDNYEKALSMIHALLRDGGNFITSDPDLEGFFFRSLVCNSLDDAVRTFRERRFRETKGETGYRFRLFDEEELRSIFAGAGFIVVKKHGISIFHSILRILFLSGNISKTDLEVHKNDIQEIFDYFHMSGKLNKHIVWHLKKRQVRKYLFNRLWR